MRSEFYFQTYFYSQQKTYIAIIKCCSVLFSTQCDTHRPQDRTPQPGAPCVCSSSQSLGLSLRVATLTGEKTALYAWRTAFLGVESHTLLPLDSFHQQWGEVCGFVRYSSASPGVGLLVCLLVQDFVIK